MSLSRLNPCELEIDLFCHGARIGPSCMLSRDARRVARTRAGLGSGLEISIPGPLKEIWMNVPVEEDFAGRSPYVIERDFDGYHVRDERTGFVYAIRIPPEPAWYARRTRRGTEMARVGVLQGTYLGIYVANSCLFWYSNPPQNCAFCTTGSNVGVNEVAQKDPEDVVEVARAAKEESSVTFVHLNSGHQAGRDLELAEPYIRALKERVGMLVGVQLMPSKSLAAYDRLIDLGVDHLSFCYEFHNPEYFTRLLPGKERWIGQEGYFKALEYTSRRMGKGTVSGEIIAGIEPIEDTLRAIDYITSIGAFPTVCIFRPLIGADLERLPPPRYEAMRAVFAHVYQACRRHGIPIGVAPNVEVSLVVQPDDTRYLASSGFGTWLYERRLAFARNAARPFFAQRMRSRIASEREGTHEVPPLELPPVSRPTPESIAIETMESDCSSPREARESVSELAAGLRKVFAMLREAAARSDPPADCMERDAVLELSPREITQPSRCRMKVFRPRPGRERLCAFFYKRSNVPWSDDRFSYGAVEFFPDRITTSEMEQWLAWLTAGLDPASRPSGLKRAFQYSIPD